MTQLQQLIGLRQQAAKLVAAANDVETGLLALVANLDDMIKAAWPTGQLTMPDSLSSLLDPKADCK